MSILTGPSRKQILLVDADDAAARAIAAALEPQAEVTIAGDGHEGVRIAALMPVLHLILTEATLPGLDGLRMVRQIRSLPAKERTPVVFVSAKAGPRDIIRGIQAGARHYLAKPVDLGDLARRVQRILQGDGSRAPRLV